MNGTSRYGQPCAVSRKRAPRGSFDPPLAIAPGSLWGRVVAGPARAARSRLRRVRTRRFGDTDLEASEIGFGTWALGSTWWGDVSEQTGERLLLRGARARHHLLRDRRRLRPGRQRGARRAGARPAPRPDPALDASSATCSTRAAGSTPRASGRSAGTAPSSARPSRRACGGSGPTTSTSTSSTTRAWTRSTPTSCFATLEELQAEGKIRHYGVALGPAIGWREEGLRAICEPRDRLGADRLQPARAGPGPRPHGRGRRARRRRDRPGPDLIGPARRQPDARRPPSAPATTAATARASGWSTGCRRSSGSASCASPGRAARWPRRRFASSSPSLR